MEFKKSILSFLLLFSYTIGFAHDFIPHYHLEDIHFGVGNNELHAHVSPENSSANDVQHGNHLDSGIYDYLVCAFNEANHSNHADKNDILQTAVNSIANQGEHFISGFPFVYSVESTLPVNKLKVCSKPILDNSNCLSSRSHRRGPPIFS